MPEGNGYLAAVKTDEISHMMLDSHTVKNLTPNHSEPEGNGYSHAMRMEEISNMMLESHAIDLMID